MDNKHQKTQNSLALIGRKKSEALAPPLQRYVLSVALQPPESSSNQQNIMEGICDRDNLKQALAQVRQNKGSPGIDGMTVDDLGPYLKEHWPTIKEQLLKGTYQPHPVKQVEIPKPGGKGVRKLGIPIVRDRFIQQAVMQVLQKKVDQTFSENSFGFRPKRSTHQAIAKTQEYIAQGYRVVVDMDLEKFFDTVNHDKLMSEMAKRIPDKRVLKLIRAFLKVGILKEGERIPSKEGTQQGSPLSPLLSNILLDLLDKELERREHRFCRYADDCNIYVKSERAGHRVMASLRIFIATKLKLKVNEQKSPVERVYRRSFLGFSFTSGKVPKRRIAPETIKQFKKKIQEYTRAGKGMRLEKVMGDLSKYLRGWLSYFGFCQTPSVLRNLEGWMHRRLRCAFWRQWSNGKKKASELRRLGVRYKLSINTAGTNKGPWHTSNSQALHIALPGEYFKQQGLPKFVKD